MEKVYISRVSKCNEVNKNNVIYSEELFQKSMKEAFERLHHIPVVDYIPSLYGANSEDLIRLTTIDPTRVLGTIVDLSDIKPDGIDIVPIKEKEKYLKELIENRYRLGLRYTSNNPQMDMSGMIRLSNMKVISYDLLPPSRYDFDEADNY